MVTSTINIYFQYILIVFFCQIEINMNTEMIVGSGGRIWIIDFRLIIDDCISHRAQLNRQQNLDYPVILSIVISLCALRLCERLFVVFFVRVCVGLWLIMYKASFFSCHSQAIPKCCES